MEPTCPVLTAYLDALLVELRRSPRLHEAQIEQLEELLERLGEEPSARRTRETRQYRALLCFIFALDVVHKWRVLLTGDTPTLVIGGERRLWLPAMRKHLADLAETYQMKAGEMGLIGVARNEQQLRYENLQTASDLLELCQRFAEMIEELATLPSPDDVPLARQVGTLFHEAGVLGKVQLDTRAEYAKRLLLCGPPRPL